MDVGFFFVRKDSRGSSKKRVWTPELTFFQNKKRRTASPAKPPAPCKEPSGSDDSEIEVVCEKHVPVKKTQQVRLTTVKVEKNLPLFTFTLGKPLREVPAPPPPKEQDIPIPIKEEEVETMLSSSDESTSSVEMIFADFSSSDGDNQPTVEHLFRTAGVNGPLTRAEEQESLQLYHDQIMRRSELLMRERMPGGKWGTRACDPKKPAPPKEKKKKKATTAKKKAVKKEKKAQRAKPLKPYKPMPSRKWVYCQDCGRGFPSAKGLRFHLTDKKSQCKTRDSSLNDCSCLACGARFFKRNCCKRYEEHVQHKCPLRCRLPKYPRADPIAVFGLWEDSGDDGLEEEEEWQDEWPTAPPGSPKAPPPSASSPPPSVSQETQ